MSKTFLAFLFVLLYSITPTFAQTDCGTVMPQSTLDWIRSKRFYENIDNSRTIYRIPIQFHIVGTSTGIGYFPANDVFRLLCQLNEKYEPVGFYFYVDTPFHYINNSNYYDHDYDAGIDMMIANNVANKVNIYIVDNPAGNCGYYMSGVDAIAIAKSCAGNNSTTLTHELGHFFSLPHTFSGWEGAYDSNNDLIDEPNSSLQERVNGSNCATAGDGFCDTPADYISYRWQCPLGFYLTDPLGVQFKPDPIYYMSYSSDVCQKKFSEEQISAMRTYLTEEHSDLIGNPSNFNDEQPLQTHIFHPAPDATEVNNNHVLLSWNNVNAAKYYVEIVQFSSPTATNITTYVEDTFYVANLSANLVYYAYVRPLNIGNTCTPPASVAFQTGNATNLYINNLSSQMPLCSGNSNGSTSVSIAGGQSPYSFAWSNGSTSNSINNLTAGIYQLTVTDNVGTTQQLSVFLPQPNPITAQHQQTSNFQTTLTATAGTPNYSYLWSNGATTASPTNLAVGQNSVTITDANGCTLTKDITILGIQELLTPIACTGDLGSIGFVLTGGTEPYEYEWSTEENSNTISELSAGNYSVTITDQGNANAAMSYTLSEPTPINGSISVYQNTATANISGGTPPYSYYWPTGLTNDNHATGLPPFSYEVIVYDNNGCQKSLNFTVTTVLGIDPTATSPTCYLSPSLLPSGTTVRLTAPQQRIEQIQIYSLDGKNLWNSSTQHHDLAELPTEGLLAGTYLVSVVTDKGHFTHKLIVL